MKQNEQHRSSSKKIWIQLFAVVILIGFPLAMILINGNQAISGILWKVEESESSIAQIKVKHAPTDTYQISSDSLFFGVYDPEKQFKEDNHFGVEHIYISWLNFTDSLLTAELTAVANKGRIPLLTIEPWPYADTTDLLIGIISGNYDTLIGRITTIVSNLESAIYISWGHEMDQDLSERYP